MASAPDLLPGLFHEEFARLVAGLARRFGLAHLATAEDLAADTFARAAEVWAREGPPSNPRAWLYAVARQQALQWLRHQKVFEQKIRPALAAQPEAEEFDFSPRYLQDSQLQMIFAICTPLLAGEAQIALALRVLCGFGIDEIAEAFFTSRETINKRLFRAKDKLRREQVALLPPEQGPDLTARLANVLHVLYLLFSEGYYSAADNPVLRQDLCWEALRLGLLLTDYPATDQPETNALVALMCFHASRFSARQPSPDALLLYDEQDKSSWNAALIERGWQYLGRSASGDTLSTYHLEARIAAWHCAPEDSPGKWEQVLQLYNQLLQLAYSPGAALNRTFALYKARGREAALPEALKLQLEANRFYHVLLGELYASVDNAAARRHWQTALGLARSGHERQAVQAKLDGLA